MFNVLADMLWRERAAASDHLIVTLREWAMTTSSDEVTDDDLYEFLYCPQGYYLTYLIENGNQPANGVAPELLENLGRFYREHVKIVGNRPEGVFVVCEEVLSKPDVDTYLQVYIDWLKTSDGVTKEPNPKRLKLSMWERAKLQTADDFEKLAEHIRHVRRHGSSARLCSKKRCICGCLAGELQRVALQRRHISVVHGINDKTMAALEDMGIFSWEQLLQTPTQEIVATLTERTLPTTNIEKVKHSARSYVEGRAVVFGTIPPIGSSYVVLDIEYLQDDPACPLFLIGVCVVTGDKPPEYHYLGQSRVKKRRRLLRVLPLS